jgi:hypothetical protein
MALRWTRLVAALGAMTLACAWPTACGGSSGAGADAGTGDGSLDTQTADTQRVDSTTADTGLSETGTPDTGAADSSAGDGNSTDTGPADTGAGDTGTTDASDAGALPFHAQVYALEGPGADGGTFHSLLALAGSGGAPAGQTCTGVMSGNCCYRPPAGPADAGPTPPNMGAVTISNAMGAQLAVLTPLASGTYPANSMATWNPGDTLTVSAAGNQIHAFAGTLQTGVLFLNVNPPLSVTMPTVINRAQAFVVSWTVEGVAGELLVFVIGAITSGAVADGDITCIVSESAGTVTVDGALLGNFAASDTASLLLERAIFTPAPDDNAAVSLVGLAAVVGAAAFQ